ncbi:MAG TPA: alpha/beta hydrolase [Sphingopyxis sp.]|nr:alpha/beta hydrolase [Sphingopyxis sp.]
MAFLRMAVAAFAAATATPLAAAGGVEPDRIVRDVVYLTAGDRALHLDLYLHPDARKAPAPLLVHFHGGGWARGTRPESWTGFRAYVDAGFSLATVQYRLAGEGRAPAAVQDARCALHWLGANAGRLGIDPRRIVVTGTSSGGHLALMAGLLPPKSGIDLEACRDAPRAAAIVDFYGPADLTAARAAGGRVHPTIANWIGPRRDADAMIRLMSPVTWASADSPPVFIAHGDADPVVPLSQSEGLKARLDALGVASELHIVAGGGHGRFEPAARAAMTARALAFLCAHGLPAARACKN